MSQWSDSIFENDLAMNLIARMHNSLKNGVEPKEIVPLMLRESCEDEEIVVLATFELMLTGNVFYTPDVLNSVDELIAKHSKKSKIKKRLITLKEELLESTKAKSYKYVEDSEVHNWFNTIRILDKYNQKERDLMAL